jgi:phage shock protein A
VKYLELSLDSFEQNDPQIYALLDTFLDLTSSNPEEMKEEVELLSTLVENLSNQVKESEQYHNFRKRIIRVLKNCSKKMTKETTEEKVTNGEEKHASESDSTIPVYTSKDFYGLLVESQNKIEELRAQFDIQNFKRKKGQELTELCESLAQYTSNNLKLQQMVEQKLQQVLDGIIMIYGGNGKEKN